MKNQRKLFDLTCAVFLALLFVSLGAVQAFGQESRGTIIGRVADPTGAALVGVKVDIISAATNVTSTVTTNDEGRFSAPFLLPGAYRVTAEKTGFKRFVQSGVEVRVSETTDLNIGMQTGDVNEAVEVTASTPLLDTAGSSLGQVIDERRVQELPLFAGNPMELTLIAAGVVNSTDMRLRKAGFNNA
ncbi:MAG: carboxypeptidase-like regulatory domain-containing protein, partial [Blastocatellia bacterium]